MYNRINKNIESIYLVGNIYCRITLIVIITVFLAGCSDLTDVSQADLTADDMTDSNQQWRHLLDEFETASVVIVQKDGSIQEAIDAAKPGEVISIEPGVYQEDLSINKSITLVGLDTENTGPVILENPAVNPVTLPEGIMIQNIVLRNYQLSESKLSQNYGLRMGRNHRSISINREELGEGIALYTLRVRTGNGKYDRITLHRLIHENNPYHPSPSIGNIIMVHGASQNFEDIYLEPGTSEVTPQTSVAMYLASNGIDVWGIDLGWTHVPVEETEFSFMENWGVEREVQDILKGVSIARLVRGITGQGFGRMNLLGFSYSVGLAYVAGGYETQEPWVKRDLAGIIAVDGQLKFDPNDASAIGLSCSIAGALNTDMTNGIFHSQSGVGIFGILAASAPNDPSPIIPGFTNYQAALFLGTNTYNLAPLPNSFWHFVAGVYDNGIPVDLAYSSPDRWIQLLAAPHGGPYMPLLTQYEFRSCECDPQSSPLDDNLAKIQIPILYLGSGGGVSSQGFHTVDQLGSTDKTKYIVSLNPEPALDFGHGDLFIGDNAPSEVWEVIRQWLLGVSI